MWHFLFEGETIPDRRDKCDFLLGSPAASRRCHPRPRRFRSQKIAL